MKHSESEYFAHCDVQTSLKTFCLEINFLAVQFLPIIVSNHDFFGSGYFAVNSILPSETILP